MSANDEKLIMDFVEFLLKSIPKKYWMVATMLQSKAKEYIELNK